MADEVVKMIKAKGMEDSCVIIGLDYKLINYVEQKYSEMKTGYLYFFEFGNLGDIKSDYLIMEEREATPLKISEIHSFGKKAYVWTVNTEESIRKFVGSNVDGIITDKVKAVEKA